MEDDIIIKKLWEMGPLFVHAAPHSGRLGIRFVAVDRGRATLSLPYGKHLIGDPRTRVIHGGAVTTLLDQAAGLAAIAGFKTLGAVATLNLAIDYMRPAKPEATIIAQAHCYKTTRHVAFIRAVAHDGDDNDPVATCQAKFMATGNRLIPNQEAQDKAPTGDDT